MLKIHAFLTQDVGVPTESCFIMENGDVLALTSDSVRPVGHLVAGDMYIDGGGIGDIGNVVLHDRHLPSEEGLALTAAAVDIEKKEILAGPDILSRGFAYMRELGEMISEAQRILFRVLRECLNGPDCLEYKLKEAMAGTLQPFLFRRTERHPMTLPMVMTPDEEQVRGCEISALT